MRINFDFDQVRDWGPELSSHLITLVPADAGRRIKSRDPEYIEDSAKILFADICTDQRSVISAVSEWVKSRTVAAFHGSRLDDNDVHAIRSRGVRTLVARERKAHLEKKLAGHPDWAAHRDRIDSVLEQLGAKNREGKREGEAHLTLSRASLVKEFNHYLTHGSEFDQRAAHALLGDAGKELLAQYGRPVIVTVAVPGPLAFEACNRFTASTREKPNLVRQMIEVWAHWLAHREFSGENGLYDCGLIFSEDLPSDWIVSIEALAMADPGGDEIASCPKDRN